MKKTVISDQVSVKTVMAAAVFLIIALHLSLSSAFASEIKSRAAVVMEASTGRVLYAKNPELRLMPASTTKLMTALIVVEQANLRDVVTVSRNAVSVAPTKSGFKEGDQVTIETLLYSALMKSSNDAAVALAEAVAETEEQFVELMNRKALALGATDTKFINTHGLPGRGQYTTAYDLSKIMRQAIKHPVLKEILGTRSTELSTETGKSLYVKNTNKLLWSDDELIGGKTGFTNAARHCFVCAGERDSNMIIVALLGAASRTMLWKETEDLMDFGSKVLKDQEEPVVYLSRSDYDAAHLKNAAYTKKAAAGARLVKGKQKKEVKSGLSSKKKTVKAKNRKNTVSKSKGTIKVKAGGKTAAGAAMKVKAKDNRKTKMTAKEKKTSKTDMAVKGQDATKG